MTIDQLRTLPPGEILWDKNERASIRGLHAIANSDGSISFLLYYRAKDGRQRRPKIGTLGEITLGEARKRAKILKDKVAAGEDPKGDWDESKAELTVQGLWGLAWAGHWSQERYQKSGWGREAKRLYTKEIEPDFGNAKLSELTAFRVREWHRKKGDSPYQANRALAVLSKMFRYAEEQELRPQHSNPCGLVKNHPERKRNRFATGDEIAAIAPLLAAEEETHLHGVAFLSTLVYSGSRPKFLEEACWPDLQEITVGGEVYGILTLAGKGSEKSGQLERVIIPPQAMRLILKLPRIEGETIFGIKMPRKLWKRIKEKVGCPDLWARDWRRTFATVGMSNGVGKDIIGELLNHKSTQTTNIYAKLMDENRLGATLTIANQMEGLMRGKKTATR